MKYLVMECHPAYAVVLDEKGSFHKVANLDYEVGQTVTAVVFSKGRFGIAFRHWFRPLTIAACVCLVLLLSVQYLLTPWGSVRVTVNPDMILTVNRLDRVIAAEGLNADGVRLLDAYEPGMKPIKQVLRELTELAAGLGMLSEGDRIHLSLASEGKHYSEADVMNLAAELEVSTHGQYHISTQAETDPSTGTTAEIPSSARPTEDEDEDDEDEDEDEDDDPDEPDDDEDDDNEPDTPDEDD